MITKKKSYIAYALMKRKDEYSPPLDDQIKTIYDRYERRFGSKPSAHFLGPITDERGHTLIKNGELWIEIPSQKRTFTTAY